MIIHTLLHLIVGSYLLILFVRPVELRSKLFILLLGAFIGLAPDLTKFFGDLLLHSVFSIPIISLVYTVLLRVITKTNLLISYLKVCIVAFVSHHLIDLLGNGISLFLPLNTAEQELDVIPDSLEIIIVGLFAIGILLLLTKVSYRIVILPMCIVAIVILMQTVSSVVVQNKLNNTYAPETITMTPHNTLLHWSTDTRLEDGTIIIGTAQLFQHKVQSITESNE